MKKVILAVLAGTMIGSIAAAVSIEFKMLQATEISDLTTILSDDGVTKNHVVKFKGPALDTLFVLLPRVTDVSTDPAEVIKTMRMLNIHNEAHDRNIYLECNRVKEAHKVECSITLIEGAQPG